MSIILIVGGINASYSAEATDRIRSSNAAASSGVRMQFKQTGKNLCSESPAEKNVSHIILFPPGRKWQNNFRIPFLDSLFMWEWFFIA